MMGKIIISHVTACYHCRSQVKMTSVKNVVTTTVFLVFISKYCSLWSIAGLCDTNCSMEVGLIMHLTCNKNHALPNEDTGN